MADRSGPTGPPDLPTGARTREEFFRALVEHTLDIVLVLDTDLVVRFVSPSVRTILGYDPIELIGTPGLDRVHPDDASRLLMVFGPSLEEPGATATLEYRIRHKEGHWVLMEGVAANRRHEPAVGGIILNARDVTERRRMEEAVRESERRLRGLIEHSLDGIAVVDAGGRNVFNSDALGRIMGYAAEELAGRSAFELIHPADLSLAQSVFARVLAEPGQPIALSVRTRHRSGDWRDLSLVAVNRLADSAVQGVVIHFRDVTDERRLERQVAVQQQRLEAFFEAAPIGLVILDDQYRYVQINRMLARMHGLAPDAHIGRTVMEVLPDIAHLIIPVLDQVRETGRPVYDVEWRARHAENVGHLRRIRGSFFPIDGEYGQRHVAGIMADITAQRAAEEALRESEEQYRRIVETTSEGVWVLDAGNRTEYVNPQMARMLGYEPDAILGRSAFDFVEPGHREEAAESLRRRRRRISERIELPYRHRDGHLVWAELKTSPIVDDRGQVVGALAMVSDVSGRKALEEQFRQAQKMEAVGQLAGGIAHDFNNLLTAILGHAQLLVEDASPGAPQADGLREIIRAAESATRLTGQLLAFSRRQILQPTRLDLNEVVESVRGMLTRVIGENITLETRLQPEIGPVLADRGQIEQLLMNLVVNARDAMPEGGRLTIATARRDLREDEPLDAGALEPGPYVAVIVSDTGVGMDPATREHLFEPFFTTKGNLGTGLGLATVYGVVTQSGGGIHLATAPGEGTTFTIFLPVNDGPLAAPQPAAPAARSRPAESQTILVVEDEDGVRALIARVLSRRGYRVIQARTPDEAIRIADDPERTIDLMLTDVVMPGMHGPALAEAVGRLRPALKVLFMSGYSEPEMIVQSLQRPGAQLLHKPFAPAVLLESVRQALDSRTA